MSYRSTISCRLHHSPAESAMASSARQPYSLAVVMCMGDSFAVRSWPFVLLRTAHCDLRALILSLLIDFVNNAGE